MSGRAVRLRTVTLWTLLGLVSLVLVVLGAVSLILATNAGTRWAISQLVSRVDASPGSAVAIGQVQGTLLRGVTLRDIRYSDASVELAVDRVAASWNPYTLISRRFYSPALEVDGVMIDIAPPLQPEAQPRMTPSIAFPALPVSVEIDSVSISRLIIRQGPQEYAPISFSTGVFLAGQNLQLDSLSLEAQAIRFDGDITAILSGQLPFEAEVSWSYTGLDAPLDSLSGRLSVRGNLVRVEIENDLLAPASISSSGSIDTGLGDRPFQFDLLHSASALELPYAQLDGYRFDDLSLVTRGQPASLSLRIDTNLITNFLPQVELQAEGVLANQGISVEEFEIRSDTGTLSGSADVGWRETLQVSMDYHLLDSNPLNYLDLQLPLTLTNLSSTGILNFSQSEIGPVGSLQLTELTGNFGDYPFDGGGHVELIGDTIQFEQMRLATSSNELQFTGSLGEILSFEWSLDAPRLTQFIPDLDGVLSAQGTLSGNPESPAVAAIFNGSNLTYENFAIGQLNGEIRRQDAEISGQIRLDRASYETPGGLQTLSSLSLTVEGTESAHQATLAAIAEQDEVLLGISGGFSDFSTLAWRGGLEFGTFDTPAGTWTYSTGGEIEASRDAIDLDEVCLVQMESRLCLTVSAGLQSTRPLTAELTLQEYPLGMLNYPDARPPGRELRIPSMPSLPERVILEGSTDVEASFSLTPNSPPAVRWQVIPSGVALRIKASDGATDNLTADSPEPDQLYEFDDIQLNGSLDNAIWLVNANTRIVRQVSDGISLNLDGRLESNLRVDPDSNLEGNLSANLDDIGWISALVPELSNVTGQLSGEVSLNGTIANPVVASDLVLSNAGFGLIPLGINVTDTQIRLTSPNNDRLQLEASASSGGGALQLNGHIDQPFSDDRKLEANLTGDAFELANNQELSVRVSPDVTLIADAGQIHFSGSLHIPLLTLELITLPETAIDVSRDAIVVDYPADRPELARSVAADQGTLFNIPVSANLQIDLGDEIRFSGFGLIADLAGNLDVQQHANGTNLTYGSLEIVQGSFEMYGQALQIRQGELLFFGAYDNPALDIRATREIEGITAGVLMNGTLKNIQSQLFSTPALADSDIIAILATGKPFSEVGEQDNDAMIGAIATLGLNRSQGLTNQVRDRLGLDTLGFTNTGNINNAALTIGKYLTPDLFIRYGVGLFDHQSKLALDYTLTERITLQAESGEYQSVDVIYKVER